MKTVAIIGASRNPGKFGNKAVRAFTRQGYRVIPVNLHETEIEGWPAYRSVLDVAGPIDMATLYVPPAVSEAILVELAQKGITEVWFNPGSESRSALARAAELGLTTVVACSILGVGESPSAY